MELSYWDVSIDTLKYKIKTQYSKKNAKKTHVTSMGVKDGMTWELGGGGG